MKLPQIILTIILALVAGFAGAYMAKGKSNEAVSASAYDRVKQSGVLKCGYASIGAPIAKDPATGEVKGFAKDIVDAAAGELGLKVEWVVEVGFADFAEGLKAGRYDAFCALTVAPHRAREALYTRPLYDALFYTYARGDNMDVLKGNMKGKRYGTIDGEVFQSLSRDIFPGNTEMSLPNMTPSSQLFTELETGKVDFVMHDAAVFREYNANNPGKVVAITDTPQLKMAVAMTVDADEANLRDMLNVGIFAATRKGKVANILKAHGDFAQDNVVSETYY